MTDAAGGWEERIGPDLDPALVRRVVACAALPGALERLQRSVAQRLGAGGSTDRDAVLADVLKPAPPPLAPPPAASRPLTPPPPAADAAGRALADAGARVLVYGTAGYPAALATSWPELGAPLWLFARAPAGSLPDAPAVAVVGTRRATRDGLVTARALGRFLARRGITVVSGLARGIDQAAHAGALDLGGATVAVLGTGFGVDYPRGDGHVREAVGRAGGLVTEYLPGTPPRPHQFLARNRLIAGLAHALVVVEGQSRSGALHTARLAAEQGREVYVVPGSLNAPTSQGPLALFRDGATLLTAFDDVLGVLPAVAVPAAQEAPPSPPAPAVAAGLDAAARRVLGLLGPVPARAGDLAATASLPVAAVLTALGDLEGRGLCAVTGRGFVAAGPTSAGSPAGAR